MKMKPFFDIFAKKEKSTGDNYIKKIKPKLKVIADYREKNSLVASEIINLGLEVEFENLKVADYIVGNVAIERKTVSDFISSMINKRLVRQLEELQQYENRLLIIEGLEEQELYDDKKDFGVNANAIRGFILTILLRFRVPIIFTKNEEDTAGYIAVIIKKKKQEPSLNVKKKSLDKKEQIQYILEGFPGIGPKTAKKLLKEFKTIKNMINTPMEKLKEVIGKKAGIFKIVEDEY
mgnify:CR=1 FL=1